MDENTTKIIKEKFDSLPESIKDLIMSSHYQDTFIEIGKKYQLNIEELGILEQETTLVVMGLTPTKDFENELIKELKIDRTKGNQIVIEINEKIFSEIRELLKSMYPSDKEPLQEEVIEEKTSPSILDQKLSGTVQTQKTETEHSLTNMTKNDTNEKTTVDPYRMPIE